VQFATLYSRSSTIYGTTSDSHTSPSPATHYAIDDDGDLEVSLAEYQRRCLTRPDGDTQEIEDWLLDM
jgi:hypothetical protein